MKDVIEYLYKEVYQCPDYEERLQETLYNNRKRQGMIAYTRYKIDREGNKIPYINKNNKWEELEDIIKIS